MPNDPPNNPVPRIPRNQKTCRIAPSHTKIENPIRSQTPREWLPPETLPTPSCPRPPKTQTPKTPSWPPPANPATNKDIKRKWKLCRQSFHILRPPDALPNSPFTTSETMRDYYLTRHIQHSPRPAERPRTRLAPNTLQTIGGTQGGTPTTAENQPQKCIRRMHRRPTAPKTPQLQ